MTDALLVVIGVLVWSYASASLIVWWEQRRSARALDRHIDEAIALTLPLGPEDYPDWSEPFLAELISGGLIDELAQAARRHDVMISISIYPHSPESDDE